MLGKKGQGGAVFLSVERSSTVSASLHHLSDIQQCLIMLFSVLHQPVTVSVHFIQIKQQLAKITCTVLYLNKCFLIRLGLV